MEKKEITVKDAKIRKIEVEQDIRKLLIRYESETGIEVTGLTASITREKLNDGSSIFSAYIKIETTL